MLNLTYKMSYSAGIVQLFMVARYLLCLINVWKICIQIGGLQFVGYGKYHGPHIVCYCHIYQVAWTVSSTSSITFLKMAINSKNSVIGMVTNIAINGMYSAMGKNLRLMESIDLVWKSIMCVKYGNKSVKITVIRTGCVCKLENCVSGFSMKKDNVNKLMTFCVLSEF